MPEYLASEVGSDGQSGFAVRCEAAALPRRSRDFLLLGSAPRMAFGPATNRGKAGTKGIAHNYLPLMTAGLSRRLTSDGKAVTTKAKRVFTQSHA